tara:strand:+ start:100 stop:357 length:258 start_codon:yes stop_codon:yes gene_type:complete
MSDIMNETEINEALQAWADSWLGNVQVIGPNQDGQFIDLADGLFAVDEWECIAEEFILYLQKTFGLRYAKSGYDRFPDTIHLRKL